MPYEFVAQGGSEQDPGVAGELGERGAAPGVDDGERGPGALDLAGGPGQQPAGGVRLQPEDGGDLVRRELVAYGELQGLALLGVVPAASGQARAASWAARWSATEAAARAGASGVPAARRRRQDQRARA
ncbi:hypothetical protein [Actinacidiphila bryophytorum]|uniref:hypothetical protein n=1 Tax=Actinacidiphila bryophytorum TaxID=1436133 RepID=UPI002AFF294C|nr:hypothetical protein [Actinacidiphila bryophytorum]